MALELKDEFVYSCKCSNHFENLQHKGNYLRQLKATQFKNSNFWQQMQKYVTFKMMTNSLLQKNNTFILDFDLHYMVKERLNGLGTQGHLSQSLGPCINV